MHMGPYPTTAPPIEWLKPRRLAVCHLLATPPSLSASFLASEIRALRALGHMVVPVVLGDHGGPMQPDELALREEAIGLEDVETLSALTAAAANPAGLAAAVGFAQRQQALPRRTLLRNAARLAYTARARGCTHIHTHFAQAGAAVAICGARIAGITASFTAHGQDLAGGDGDLALKLAAADLAIAISEDAEVAFRRLAPHARIRTIPIGVPADRFVPQPGPGNARLLTIGRLAQQNGYHALLVALAHLHPLLRPDIDVIGDGPLRGELEALAHDLGLGQSVQFLGAKTADWIAAEGPHYQGLVAPGMAAPDGPGGGALALKEAMAMGLPVIAARVPGLREVVDESCGRLFNAGDVPALAEAMVWLADLDPAARGRLGAAGRARVQERFTLRQQATRLVAAFAELQA